MNPVELRKLPQDANTTPSVFRSYFTANGRAAARTLLWLIFFMILSQLCGVGVVFLLIGGMGREHFGVYRKPFGKSSSENTWS